MAAARHLVLSGIVLVIVSAQVCLAGEDDSLSKKPMDMFGDTMKGMTGMFQGMADTLKDKAEDGMEAFKGLSSGVKEKSEEGVEAAKGLYFKGWGEAKDLFGDGLSKAKDGMMEHGDNIKKTLSEAALHTKDEMEDVASKLSKHAKDTSDYMFKMFGIDI